MVVGVIPDPTSVCGNISKTAHKDLCLLYASVVPLPACRPIEYNSDEGVWLLIDLVMKLYSSLSPGLPSLPLHLSLRGNQLPMFCEHPLMPATMERSHNEKLEPPAEAGWEELVLWSFLMPPPWERPRDHEAGPPSWPLSDSWPPPLLCDMVNKFVSWAAKRKGDFITTTREGTTKWVASLLHFTEHTFKAFNW